MNALRTGARKVGLLFSEAVAFSQNTIRTHTPVVAVCRRGGIALYFYKHTVRRNTFLRLFEIKMYINKAAE